MRRLLIVKNVNTTNTLGFDGLSRSEFFGDAASDAFGPIATEAASQIISIDWDEFPDIIEVRQPRDEEHDEGWNYPKLIKIPTGYVDTDTITGHLSFVNYFLEPVYFENGFVGWSLHHYPMGFQPSPPTYSVGIWRRAYDVSIDHGISPLGRYTFIRWWDTTSQEKATFPYDEEQYLAINGATVEITEIEEIEEVI